MFVVEIEKAADRRQGQSVAELQVHRQPDEDGVGLVIGLAGIAIRAGGAGGDDQQVGVAVGMGIEPVLDVAGRVGRDRNAGHRQEDIIRNPVGPAIDIRMAEQAVAEIVIIVELQIGGEIVGRIPLQCHPANEILQPLAAVGKDRRRARFQFDIFVDILILGRDANAERVADRPGNIAADGIAFLFKFIRGLATDFPVGRRIGGADREDPGRGAFAEEQGLRTFQNIDLLDVEEGGLDQPHRAHRDTVEIKGDRRVEGSGNIGRADTAQADLATSPGPADLNVQRGNAADDIGDFVDLEFIERIATNRGDGNRRFLQCFILLACGDDDDVAGAFVFQRILGESRRAEPAGADGYGRAQEARQ